MTIGAKPPTYTVNTGHTHCPDHLWMIDEGSGASLTDRGKTGGYNLTLSATTGAGPDWVTDGTHGPVLDFVSANEDRATNGSISGLSGTQVVVVIAKGVAGAGTRCMVSVSDDTQLDRYVDLVYQGDEDVEVLVRFDNTLQTNTSNTDLTLGWDVVALRFSDTTVDWSLNGSAWATFAITNTGMIAAMNAFALGCQNISTPAQFWDDNICAAMWWHGSKSDAEIAAIAADPWQFLTTTVKKLKLLVHSDAQSDASIAGVVFAAPGGSDITGAKIGEFTGAAFEASLEGGKAVLKVPVSDFSGTSLSTSDTPVALVRNTTDTTGLIAGTVIEE